MEKYESLGFTALVTKDKLKIEIPIKNLVNGFKDSPNNFNESTVKHGCRQEFAKFVAERLIDSNNPETGESLIMEAIEMVFEELFESAEDFIKYPDDEE